MAGKWQLRDREAERAIFSSRLFVASIVCLVLFAILLINLFNLQVMQHDYFSSRADGNRLHSQYVAPSRGLIFDSAGALLADNQPIFNLNDYICHFRLRYFNDLWFCCRKDFHMVKE